MAAIIAFGVSLVALMFFLAFKLFETSHTINVYTSARKKGDALIILFFQSIHHRLKSIEKHLSAKNVFLLFVHHTASAVARTARRVEDGAQNVTRTMARSNNGESRSTKSKFLEEVTSHKEGLDTERVRRETSLTEEREDL